MIVGENAGTHNTPKTTMNTGRSRRWMDIKTLNEDFGGVAS